MLAAFRFEVDLRSVEVGYAGYDQTAASSMVGRKIAIIDANGNVTGRGVIAGVSETGLGLVMKSGTVGAGDTIRVLSANGLTSNDIVGITRSHELEWSEPNTGSADVWVGKTINVMNASGTKVGEGQVVAVEGSRIAITVTDGVLRASDSWNLAINLLGYCFCLAVGTCLSKWSMNLVPALVPHFPRPWV